MAFSAYGRVLPEAMATLTAIAKRGAMKRGLGDHRLLLRRAMAGVGVAIWRRAAAMVRACLPAGSREAVALALGADAHGDAGADGGSFVDVVSVDGPGRWACASACAPRAAC